MECKKKWNEKNLIILNGKWTKLKFIFESEMAIYVQWSIAIAISIHFGQLYQQSDCGQQATAMANIIQATNSTEVESCFVGVYVVVCNLIHHTIILPLMVMTIDDEWPI